MIDHGFHIVGTLERGELSIGTSAFTHDPFDVRHFIVAAKLFNFGRDEFEQFIEQAACFDFGFTAEIDQLPIDAVSLCPPPVLV